MSKGTVMTNLRRRVASSPLAPIAVFPLRLMTVARYNVDNFCLSARWLVSSREHHNFTFDLNPLNRIHLAWFVANLVDSPVSVIREYFSELEQDKNLELAVRRGTSESARRRLADATPRWHKRLGWYALVRSLRPAHVVETGTDKGLGSLVLAAALRRNGTGRLTTIDTNPDSGYLIRGPYADVIDRRIGVSIDVIPTLEDIDFFLHDSLHTFSYEMKEFETAAALLTDKGVVLSDNADLTSALPLWAERTGRQFGYFHERPFNHWFPGGGIGIAWNSSATSNTSGPYRM